MQQMNMEQKDRIYKKFLSLDIPCVVFCRELEPDELFMKYALENNVALLMRQKRELHSSLGRRSLIAVNHLPQ